MEGERGEKNNNIVVFNVMEKNCENREEKMREELRLSVQVLKETGIDVRNEDIVEVHRLVKQRQQEQGDDSEENRRPRPLLIKLQDARLKWNLVKNGKNLRDSRN